MIILASHKWLTLILAIVFFVIAYVITEFYPKLYVKRPVIVFMLYLITIVLGLIYGISGFLGW